jgi:hypothetical protein
LPIFRRKHDRPVDLKDVKRVDAQEETLPQRRPLPLLSPPVRVSLPPFAGDETPCIANKEVAFFIRANAVTGSDQASMAALYVAAFPVIWLLQRALTPAAGPREARSIC